MAGMHALHEIMANCARPQRAAVTPGEYLEPEPDIFGVIVAVNGVVRPGMPAIAIDSHAPTMGTEPP